MAAFGSEQLWTVAEVARYMRVSNMTVYRLIRSGQLAALQVGKHYRIREDDLRKYLEASQTRPAQRNQREQG